MSAVTALRCHYGRCHRPVLHASAVVDAVVAGGVVMTAAVAVAVAAVAAAVAVVAVCRVDRAAAAGAVVVDRGLGDPRPLSPPLLCVQPVFLLTMHRHVSCPACCSCVCDGGAPPRNALAAAAPRALKSVALPTSVSLSVCMSSCCLSRASCCCKEKPHRIIVSSSAPGRSCRCDVCGAASAAFRRENTMHTLRARRTTHSRYR